MWLSWSPADVLSQGDQALTGERQQWCKMMQNESACCQATCIHTSSQHLPVWVNEATRMTWVNMNNSNPLRILRLYKTDMMSRKNKGKREGGKRPEGGFTSKSDTNTRRLSQSKRCGCCRLLSILRASAPNPRVCQGTTCHLNTKYNPKSRED